ncbi:hypothetical protein ANCCAN_12391 [Ancylostoma caninum]|uniref:Uncharacterized protein n=1 Tax=Ancylostoma caninum TaxID=29170 RepID=A0A368GBA3_ANCCA|nr:hypothetical protein ANCCAN_12391 [Ancylostoma caninum]
MELDGSYVYYVRKTFDLVVKHRISDASVMQVPGIGTYSMHIACHPRLSCATDVLRGHRFNVGVDIGNLIPHGKGVKMIANINGKLVEIPMKRTGAASHGGVFIAHELGRANVKVLFDDALVKEARINVRDGCDASKCRATGEGLKSAIVGKPARFDIDAQVNKKYQMSLKTDNWICEATQKRLGEYS